MKRNPKSAYVRRKRSRKPCIHCGSTAVIPMFWSDMPILFSCVGCAERYFASEGDPAMVGGIYGAYE